MLTINLLQALPRTPLWDRLEREGRLIDDEARESNVDLRMPYDQVVDIWRDTMTRACASDAVFARYHHQLTHTFPFRLDVPVNLRDIPRRKLVRGLRVLGAVLWHCGGRADYRRHFWKLARHCLKNGTIDVMIRVAIMAHHLIMSARDAAAGRQKASHYTVRPQTMPHHWRPNSDEQLPVGRAMRAGGPVGLARPAGIAVSACAREKNTAR